MAWGPRQRRGGRGGRRGHGAWGPPPARGQPQPSLWSPRGEHATSHVPRNVGRALPHAQGGGCGVARRQRRRFTAHLSVALAAATRVASCVGRSACPACMVQFLAVLLLFFILRGFVARACASCPLAPWQFGSSMFLRAMAPLLHKMPLECHWNQLLSLPMAPGRGHRYAANKVTSLGRTLCLHAPATMTQSNHKAPYLLVLSHPRPGAFALVQC